MHARRRCSGHLPVNPRVPLGAPRCGEHDGAHPVAGNLTAGEICSSEVPLPLGLADQWVQRPTVSRRGTVLGVDLGVLSVFDPDFDLIFRKGFPEIDLKHVKFIS